MPAYYFKHNLETNTFFGCHSRIARSCSLTKPVLAIWNISTPGRARPGQLRYWEDGRACTGRGNWCKRAGARERGEPERLGPQTGYLVGQANVAQSTVHTRRAGPVKSLSFSQACPALAATAVQTARSSEQSTERPQHTRNCCNLLLFTKVIALRTKSN